MTGQDTASTKVLIVSDHKRYANKVRSQLLRLHYDCSLLKCEDADDAEVLRTLAPDIIFVDLEMVAPEGLPGYEYLRNASPDSEVVLIVPLSQAQQAARLARVWEVFDYVVREFVDDKSRVPLLIERARTHSLPRLAEIRGHAKVQYHRVVEEVASLRHLLKDQGAGPIVQLLHHHKMKEFPSSLGEESPETVAATAYRDSLVDLLCGRLKRLEHLVQMAAPADEREKHIRDRILIVDDGPVDAEVAKYALEKHGYDVLVADSATTARQLLCKHAPGLVLMDIHLGDANGLKLVSAMRQHEETRHIPVIVVSSDARKDAVAAAKLLEVQGFVLKPFDPSILVAKVKQAMAESIDWRLTSSDQPND